MFLPPSPQHTRGVVWRMAAQSHPPHTAWVDASAAPADNRGRLLKLLFIFVIVFFFVLASLQVASDLLRGGSPCGSRVVQINDERISLTGTATPPCVASAVRGVPEMEACNTSYDACGERYVPPCPPSGCDAKYRALNLPLCPRGGPHTRFAYLVTIGGGGPANQVPDYGDYEYFKSGSNETELIVVTWKERTEGFPFNERAPFAANRNFLLELALQKEEARGCRFTYYIWHDEHLVKLTVDPEVAAYDGVNTNIHPHAAFREELDKHNPAVAVPKYFWMHPRGGSSFGGESARGAYSVLNFDHAFVAVHSTAARVLLPFATEVEPMHWVYAQELFSQFVSVVFLEHSHHYPSFVVPRKMEHNSGTLENNDAHGKQWIRGLMGPYLRNALVSGKPLASRIWPFGDGLGKVPQVATDSPPDVRYDVDLTSVVNVGHPMWQYINTFWEAYGSGARECGGGFCDLRNESRTQAYLERVAKTVV
jgi:hypothetical protein